MVAAAGVRADDIRIINANLITMDDANPTADTILIRGNRIVSVGVASAGDGGDPEGVTVINAGGAVVIPGIIDQHLHWNRSAITWGYALHRGESAFTLRDLEIALRERAAEVPEGEWITLIGRHNHRQFLENGNDTQSGRYPTRQELDDWVADHPVLFSQRFTPAPVGSGPDDFNRANFTGPGQMNGLAVAFFNAMTPPAPFVDPIPGDGALSDELNQQVYEWTRANNTFEDQVRSTLDLVSWSHRVGLTGVGDAGGSGFRQTQDFAPLVELARRGQLRVRNRYQLRPTGAPGVAGQAGVDALRNVSERGAPGGIQGMRGPAGARRGGLPDEPVGRPVFPEYGSG